MAKEKTDLPAILSDGTEDSMEDKGVLEHAHVVAAASMAPAARVQTPSGVETPAGVEVLSPAPGGVQEDRAGEEEDERESHAADEPQVVQALPTAVEEQIAETAPEDEKQDEEEENANQGQVVKAASSQPPRASWADIADDLMDDLRLSGHGWLEPVKCKGLPLWSLPRLHDDSDSPPRSYRGMARKGLTAERSQHINDDEAYVEQSCGHSPDAPAFMPGSSQPLERATALGEGARGGTRVPVWTTGPPLSRGYGYATGSHGTRVPVWTVTHGSSPVGGARPAPTCSPANSRRSMHDTRHWTNEQRAPKWDEWDQSYPSEDWAHGGAWRAAERGCRLLGGTREGRPTPGPKGNGKNKPVLSKGKGASVHEGKGAGSYPSYEVRRASSHGDKGGLGFWEHSPQRQTLKRHGKSKPSLWQSEPAGTCMATVPKATRPSEAAAAVAAAAAAKTAPATSHAPQVSRSRHTTGMRVAAMRPRKAEGGAVAATSAAAAWLDMGALAKQSTLQWLATSLPLEREELQ